MRGNSNELALSSRLQSYKHFAKCIIWDYIYIVHEERLPVKLAFDMDNSEILVWAEIPDDIEDIKDRLLMMEAKIKAKYHEFGYDITSTIVEKRDRLAIPQHYIVFGNVLE